jgi:small subunit ribosomal protein S16
MALAIRMTRGGRKNRPYYRIVVADKRAPRDGRFIEKLGSYDPLLKSDHKDRVVLNAERIAYWIGQGAKPSDRVARFMGQAGLAPMPKYNETPKKSAPKAKTIERNREKEEKAKAAAEAAKAAKNAPAEDPVAEAPAEAPAESAAETPADESAA